MVTNYKIKGSVMTIFSAFTILLLTLGTCFVPDVRTADGEWGYSSSDDWTDIDGSECDGPHQSPIDLLNICYNNTQITIDKDLTLYLENYDSVIKGDQIFLKNNGHSVQVGIKGGMEVQPWAPRIFGTATEEQTFQLAQVHFHWDRNNSHGGSEHELYGQKRAFEVHFVHFNTKYPDSAEADMYPDGSIVLAVLFDWNNETADNPALAPITKKLRDVQDFKEEVLLEEDFNLRGLLPTDIATFYWYQGSLTTPPCSEEITWIVFPEVQEISYKQLKSFEFSLENEDNKVLGTTARQVKPLNNRTVKISSNKHCYDGLEEEQGENDNDGNNQDGQTLNINLSGVRDTSKPIVIVLQQPVDDVDDNGEDDSSSTTSSTTTTTTTPEPTTTTTTTTTTPEPTTTTTTEEPSTTTSTSTTTTTTTTTEAPSTEEPEYDAEEVEELLMGGNDDGSNLREETDTNNNDGDLGSNDSQNGDENNGDEDEEQEEENGNEGGSNNDEVDESNNDGDGNDDQQDGKDGSGRQAQERNQEGDGGGSGQGDDGSDTVTISKETLNPMKEMFSGLFGRRKKRNSWNTRS